jgi:hypothetical protein
VTQWHPKKNIKAKREEEPHARKRLTKSEPSRPNLTEVENRILRMIERNPSSTVGDLSTLLGDLSSYEVSTVCQNLKFRHDLIKETNFHWKVKHD